MSNLYGIGYLRQKLNTKKNRVNLRYRYYEMKNMTRDLGISTPPQLHWLNAVLGWCGQAVDSIADRLVLEGFRDDNFYLWDIFQMNSPDILFDSAIISALISGCSFVYVVPDSSGTPKLQVIDGSRATGIIDDTTQMLTEGYAILAEDEHHNATLEAYFLPYETQYFPKGGVPYTIKHASPYPLLIPIIYRQDAKRPFGHSRIKRSCMALQDSACRTLVRTEITAEFYSYPQKYITGISQDAEFPEAWHATMSKMLVLEDDGKGNHPIAGQFQAASMSPHLEQIKQYAAMFGGETGLTMDDLGFASGNPSSSDAIKSAHENLRLNARKAQRCFSPGFLNVGMAAKCLVDDQPYERKAFYRTTPVWAPVFEPDGSALSGLGDAIIKINNAFPDYLTEDKLKELTGL